VKKAAALEEHSVSMNHNTRVIRFHRTGGPEVLQIDEIELPPLKNNEVLLKMDAFAISRADILRRERDYVEDPILPVPTNSNSIISLEAVLCFGRRLPYEKLNQLILALGVSNFG
jgi:hypothetical protein